MLGSIPSEVKKNVLQFFANLINYFLCGDELDKTLKEQNTNERLDQKFELLNVYNPL